MKRKRDKKRGAAPDHPPRFFDSKGNDEGENFCYIARIVRDSMIGLKWRQAIEKYYKNGLADTQKSMDDLNHRFLMDGVIMANPLKEIFGEIADGIGNAISDVREKVVEEPWFGRATSPHENAPSALQDLRDLYGVQPAQTEPAAPEIALDKDAPQPSAREELAAAYSKAQEVQAPEPAPEIEQTKEQEIER